MLFCLFFFSGLGSSISISLALSSLGSVFLFLVDKEFNKSIFFSLLISSKTENSSFFYVYNFQPPSFLFQIPPFLFFFFFEFAVTYNTLRIAEAFSLKQHVHYIIFDSLFCHFVHIFCFFQHIIFYVKLFFALISKVFNSLVML